MEDDIPDHYKKLDPNFRASEGSPRQAKRPPDKTPLLEPLVKARKAAGITQVQVARSMGTSQENVSRLERAIDMKVSTLEKYAFAVLGGLKIEVEIEGDPVVLMHYLVAVEDGGPGQG